MKAFITGISGFVGTHLCSVLMEQGWELAGLLLPDDYKILKSSDLKYTPFIGDILDPDSLAESLSAFQPTHVVHMAAASAPSLSYKQPELFFNLNVLGTQNVLETVRTHCPAAEVTLFSSADIYGLVSPEQIPLSENAPLTPQNPYAASKIAANEIGRQYRLNFGLHVQEIRPFNMIGPGQELGFVLPDWCQQIAQMVVNDREPVMSVGNLTSVRDFTDVRDAVQAMSLILKEGKNGETYQTCSGQGVALNRLLDLVLGLSPIDIEIRENPALMRPAKMPRIVGSYEKVHALCGWKPSTPLRQTVADTLAYWIDRVRAES